MTLVIAAQDDGGRGSLSRPRLLQLTVTENVPALNGATDVWPRKVMRFVPHRHCEERSDVAISTPD